MPSSSLSPWVRKPTQSGVHTLLEGKIRKPNTATGPPKRVAEPPQMSALEEQIRNLKRKLGKLYHGEIPHDWSIVIERSPAEILKEVSEALDKFHELSSMNAYCIVKCSPMHVFAKRGNLELCKHIINNIGDKNPKDDFGDTPLHWASEEGHIDVCKLIMGHNENKNPKNDRGETPLHMAAQKGHLEVFKHIVEQVADKNPGNDLDKTPFDKALANDNYDVVDYIFKYIGIGENQGCSASGECLACKENSLNRNQSI